MPPRAALIDAGWADALERRAVALWTPEYTRAVLGDKRLLLMPAEAPVLLRALGLMNGDGSIPPERVRKFRQINHLLRAVVPNLAELARQYPTVTLLDAGCGRSYLTLLVAWWFERIQRHPVRILGVDQAPALVESCRQRAASAGLRSLRFAAAPLDELELATAWQQAFEGQLAELHGVIALHACDTATDDALVLAVRHGARFVAVAPCCQAELSAAYARRASAESALAPLFLEPHLRRTAAATLTDAQRLLLLRAVGYEASANEFVEAVHTPKNTLIRAMRRGEGSGTGWSAFDDFVAATGGVAIGLAERLHSICTNA